MRLSLNEITNRVGQDPEGAAHGVTGTLMTIRSGALDADGTFTADVVGGMIASLVPIVQCQTETLTGSLYPKANSGVGAIGVLDHVFTVAVQDQSGVTTSASQQEVGLIVAK